MSDSRQENLRPESLMMSYGYKPELSEYAIKAPVFLTSTFGFKNARAGKEYFELAYGLREARKGESMGRIYSRLNNPGMEILEQRLRVWEKAEEAAVFASGMAAISTTCLALFSPGDTIFYSEPVYGGTDYLFKNILPTLGIQTISFPITISKEVFQKKALQIDSLKGIYIETPANPTNHLFDLSLVCQVAREHPSDIVTLVDNTFLGPLFQKPIFLGMDLSIYSATKFISGHSDCIAGAVLGRHELLKKIKDYRTIFGTMSSPFTGWMLMRSLETLMIRMEKQSQNAQQVASFLNNHPAVEEVYFPTLLSPQSEQYRIYQKQCEGPGSLISFKVRGGEKEAFCVLDMVRLIKLAVSLGSTESLIEHPGAMTHSDLTAETKARNGITDNLLRLSVGIENCDDLINDLGEALQKILD
jgi:methionine-gamma-lyase